MLILGAVRAILVVTTVGFLVGKNVLNRRMKKLPAFLGSIPMPIQLLRDTNERTSLLPQFKHKAHDFGFMRNHHQLTIHGLIANRGLTNRITTRA